jgi:hypothetical protein
MFTTERQKFAGPITSDIQRKNLYDLLSISLRYEFDRVTREVISFIDRITDSTNPITKLCLGLAHDCLRHWVGPAYSAIIRRYHSLTEDGIIQLGVTRTAIVGRTREKYIRDKLAPKLPSDFISLGSGPRLQPGVTSPLHIDSRRLRQRLSQRLSR